MRTITIHQPNYLPWPGFFHKWMIADVFVILDTVQYHKNEWQNRNRIKTAQGEQWLTVPVNYRFGQRIEDITIANPLWAKKHINSIEQAYRKAPFFAQYWPELKAIYQAEHQHLAALNTTLIVALGRMLGCTAPWVLASSLNISEQDPTLRLIQICQHFDADAYLSGAEGEHYLAPSAFEDVGIQLYFQHVAAPEYAQLHGDFIPFLSVLDVLFNIGDACRSTIRNMGDMHL